MLMLGWCCSLVVEMPVQRPSHTQKGVEEEGEVEGDDGGGQGDDLQAKPLSLVHGTLLPDVVS